MPERSSRGRHRRYRPSPVSRASLTMTAGGAGLALPLLGGSVTQAASEEPAAPQERPDERAVQPPVRLVALKTQGEGEEREKPYVVASGDTLSAIAAEHRLRGGWPELYQRNQRTVGGNPDLILPGQKLILRGSATAEPKAKVTPPKAKPKSSAKPKAKPKSAAKPETKPKSTAKPKTVTKPQTTTGYAAPLAQTRVGTAYGVRGSSWSSGHHTGVDFPVPVGTGVRAVSTGKVVTAGWGGPYGYQVVIRHADGRYSQYAHLSAITVRTGQQVNAGQRIARSGSTGNTTGPHLHLEIRTGPGYGSDVDPLGYLRSKGVKI